MADVTVTATLSRENSFITVDWHPHATYRSLIRVNQTTGAIDTLLDRYDPEAPPYDDWGITAENSYVYELFVPGNPGSPFRSAPTTPRVIWKPVHPHPRPIGSEAIPIGETTLTTHPADEMLSDEVKTLDQLASEETGNTDAEQAEK